MQFKTREEYNDYLEMSQSLLNEWAEKTPLPNCGIGKDENGDVVAITMGSRANNLERLAGIENTSVKSVSRGKSEEYEKFLKAQSDRNEEIKDSKGCKTCGAKGLKRLILGGAKLLKSELGIDAADAETVQNRKNICLGCEKYNFGVCEDCGCFTAAKVKLNSEACPMGKW